MILPAARLKVPSPWRLKVQRCLGDDDALSVAPPLQPDALWAASQLQPRQKRKSPNFSAFRAACAERVHANPQMVMKAILEATRSGCHSRAAAEANAPPIAAALEEEEEEEKEEDALVIACRGLLHVPATQLIR